jgi:hypothetical protein
MLEEGNLMTSEGIFVINEGTLTVLRSRKYDSENLLQDALAKFPEVLAGDSTTDGNNQQRLLLVRREMGVPAAEGAPATWSADHLFLAEDGVPVVVEVKRSSDTRIRREVVGQMLDYAANAVAYWPIANLRESLDTRAKSLGKSGDELVLEAFPGVDIEPYWESVLRHLRDGHVRMVFVADSLPPELVRIIEFLNEQMSPAEVLGVEVPQFVDTEGLSGLQVLVPRVVGRTSAAVATKSASAGVAWTHDSFLEAVRAQHGAAMTSLMERLLNHAADHAARTNWGRGATPAVSFWSHFGSTQRPSWSAWNGQRPYVFFQLPEVHQFMSPESFEAFLTLLEQIPSYKSKVAEARQENFAHRCPSLFLTDVIDRPEELQLLFEALDLLDGVGSPAS